MTSKHKKEHRNCDALFLLPFSFYYMKTISDLLTNERWAWFNSIRNTEKYREVVAWVESIEKAQEEE